jgi:hypothetical protein
LPEGLPELKGRWLAAYKVLWWAMLATALVAVTFGQWRLREETLTVYGGFYSAGLRPNETDEVLTFSPLSPAAAIAGVVPESTLLAVDGRAIPQDAPWDEIAAVLGGPAGSAVTLRLRAPDGTVAEARVVRGPEHLAAADRESPVSDAQRDMLALVSRSLNALIVIAGAALLFRRRPSDPVAALLSFGLLAVPANDIAALVADPGLRYLTDFALDLVPMACILPALATFPAGRFSPGWTWLVIPAIANWAAVMLIGGEAAPIWLQLVVALPPLLIAVMSLAWRFARMAPGPPKQQIKWVMLGFAAFIACGLVEIALYFVDNAATSNAAHVAILVAIAALAPLQGLCIVGGLLVSLLRHRLYDADAAISRSAAYAVLTVTLIAVFAASETLIQALGQQWFGANAGVTGGAFAAALAALLLVPLHQRLSRWAEKRFQRDLAKLHAELPLLLAEVRNSSDPREFADNALSLVIRGVHARHGAILLAEQGRLALAHAEGVDTVGLAERLAGELPDDPEPGAVRADDPVLPLRLPLVTRSGAHTGWIALGPHPDGSFYGKEDRKALEELARPLARAIELAIERARRDAAHDAERRTLTDRLAQLEEQLSRVVRTNPPRRPA